MEKTKYISVFNCARNKPPIVRNFVVYTDNVHLEQSLN